MDCRELILEPQPADLQDREGAPFVLRLSLRSFPFIAKARPAPAPDCGTCTVLDNTHREPTLRPISWETVGLEIWRIGYAEDRDPCISHHASPHGRTGTGAT